MMLLERTERVWLFLRFCCGLLAWMLCVSNGEAFQDQANTDKPSGTTRSTIDLIDDLEREIAGLPPPSDRWLGIMMQIHEQGEAARSDLIAELDSTNSDVMMRALAFLMRASGDNCYVPALIRAIPKTLLLPGSDMGLRANDPKCVAFAQQHDLSERNGQNEFGFGRPVREVIGALQKLTGHDGSEEAIYNIFLEGSPNQIRMKQQIYDRTAIKWSRWWSVEAPKRGVPAEYCSVQLPAPKERPPVKVAKEALLSTNGGHSNWVLSPVQKSDSKVVFLDLDTGMISPVPAQWKDGKVEENIDAIYQWAKAEGFDLMGREVKPAEDSKPKNPLFIIQPIEMDIWELPEDYWKKNIENVTFDSLCENLTSTDVLMHYDQKSQKHEPEACASFLFQTSDGTVGVLYLGVSVSDTSMSRGMMLEGDMEKATKSFHMGRRLGFTFLCEPAP